MSPPSTEELRSLAVVTKDLMPGPVAKSESPLGIQLHGDELKDFLRTLNCDWTQPKKRNVDLLQATNRAFEAEVESGRLSPEALASVKRVIPVFSAAADLFYNYHPFDLKVTIATYTTLLLHVDDLCEKDPVHMVPELQRFIATWGNEGSKPYHPHLDHFRRVVTTDLRRFYGPISMANIVHATIGFLSGTLLESAFPKGVSCPPTSSRFPRYVRIKSGCSEAYSYFIFPEVLFPEKEYFETYVSSIPDILELTDMVNDILSFYKESVVGTEENTYLMSMSRVLGCSPVDVWRDTCKRQSGVAKDISTSLSRREELQKAWDSYLDGYCMWHLTQQERYKLWEIGIETAPY